MAIAINGNGTVTGVSVGGLPDGIVDTDMLADDAVTQAKTSYAAGEIVQVAVTNYNNNISGGGNTGPFTNGTYTSMAATGLTGTFTPKFANSILTIETDFYAQLNDNDGYVRWAWYDDTNGAYFHSNSYIAGTHYYADTTELQQVILRCSGAALNTSARTYALRAYVANGGTLSFSWSNSDVRMLKIMEIKQ